MDLELVKTAATFLAAVSVPILGYLGVKQKSISTNTKSQTDAILAYAVALESLKSAQEASTNLDSEIVRSVTEMNTAITALCVQQGVLWEDKKASWAEIKLLRDHVAELAKAYDIENERIGALTIQMDKTNSIVDGKMAETNKIYVDLNEKTEASIGHVHQRIDEAYKAMGK